MKQSEIRLPAASAPLSEEEKCCLTGGAAVRWDFSGYLYRHMNSTLIRRTLGVALLTLLDPVGTVSDLAADVRGRFQSAAVGNIMVVPAVAASLAGSALSVCGALLALPVALIDYTGEYLEQKLGNHAR